MGAGSRFAPARPRPTGFAALFVDISSRKLAEKAVAESEARFRNLAQSMPNHVWTASPDGMLDWFNDRVYRYSGAPAGTLDGENWGVIVHPDDIGDAAEAWAAARHTGDQYETKFRLRRHDGAYRWHIARAVSLRDRAGRIEKWIGTNTDIQETEDRRSRAGGTGVNARTADRSTHVRIAPDPGCPAPEPEDGIDR